MFSSPRRNSTTYTNTDAARENTDTCATNENIFRKLPRPVKTFAITIRSAACAKLMPSNGSGAASPPQIPVSWNASGRWAASGPAISTSQYRMARSLYGAISQANRIVPAATTTTGVSQCVRRASRSKYTPGEVKNSHPCFNASSKPPWTLSRAIVSSFIGLSFRFVSLHLEEVLLREPIHSLVHQRQRYHRTNHRQVNPAQQDRACDQFMPEDLQSHQYQQR
ncbi:MAG: hypothetical protein KatS3mg005_1851 [Bryobacteraceae bacterium]|nr:MAG: hypothetical protein KatS3mg005_1851 [Bryobacteraceae bacterium]